MSADVEVFTAELDCEPFNWAYPASSNRTKTPYQSPNDTQTASCTFEVPPSVDVETDLTSASCFAKGVRTSISSAFDAQLRTSVQLVECEQGSDGADDPRIAIYMHTMWTTLWDKDCKLQTVPPQIEEMEGVLCTPKYSLTRRTVTNSTRASNTNSPADVSHTTKGVLPLGATIADMTRSIVASMVGVTSDSGLWFTLLTTAHPENDPIPSGSKGSKLIGDMSQDIFPSFAHQWAKSRKTVAANQTLLGVNTRTEERLCVQELSLRLMEAFLGSMILASIVLSFSRDLPAEDIPMSLLSHALVLARSPDLARVLDGTGILSEKLLKTALEHRVFSTEETTRRTITIDPSDYVEIEDPSVSPVWQPIADTWWFQMFTTTVSVLIFAVLEITYQYSTSHSGIADVSLEGYAKYAWVFVPSITVSITALAFGMLDSSARLLHPYRELQNGNAGISTLLFDPLGTPTMIAIFQSLKKRKIALFTILLTSMLGPLLTIAASGLFTAQAIPLTKTIPVRLDDWYDLSLDYTSGDWHTQNSPTRVLTISDLISFANISYPQWTYDDLAFPTMHVDNSSIGTSSSTPLTGRLPAVRVKTNCSLNDFSFDPNQLSDPRYRLVYYPKPALPCTPRSRNGTIQTPTITFARSYIAEQSDGLFASEFQGSMLTPYDMDQGWDPTITGDFCRDGWRHLWFFVGRLTAANTTTDLALVHCMPYIEALHATVHLTPHYAFSSSSPPPSPLPATARTLPYNASTLYRADGQNLFMPAPISAVLPADAFPPAANSSTIDPFFQAAIWARDGVPLAQLVGPAARAENHSTLLTTIERVYARMVAQQLRFSFRAANATDRAVDDPSAPETDLLAGLTVTFTDQAARLRLVQSAVSTRLLEGLLLLMALCAAVSRVLTTWDSRWRGRLLLLPRDPGSVAAKMGLLAGSELVERLRDEVVVVRRGGRSGGDGGDDGAVREAERAVAVAGLEGHLFSLGWWRERKEGGGEGRKFRIDVGVAERE